MVLKLDQVYNQDCLEGMKQIDDHYIDMILCDPPYGITGCKWDSIIPLNLMWDEFKRIIKSNGVICLFAAQPFTSALINSNLSMYKYCWIWNKGRGGNFVISKYQPIRITEDIVVFYNKMPVYNPIMTTANKNNNRPTGFNVSQKSDISNKFNDGFKVSVSYNENMRYPTNIIDIRSDVGECNHINRVHPTQKPILLFEYLIKTYTNQGMLILDPCMGSGTTAAACQNLNRQYIGFEADVNYYNIIQNRLHANCMKLDDFEDKKIAQEV